MEHTISFFSIQISNFMFLSVQNRKCSTEPPHPPGTYLFQAHLWGEGSLIQRGAFSRGGLLRSKDDNISPP